MEVKADERVPEWVTSMLARHDCQLDASQQVLCGAGASQGYQCHASGHEPRASSPLLRQPCDRTRPARLTRLSLRFAICLSRTLPMDELLKELERTGNLTSNVTFFDVATALFLSFVLVAGHRLGVPR